MPASAAATASGVGEVDLRASARVPPARSIAAIGGQRGRAPARCAPARARRAWASGCSPRVAEPLGEVALEPVAVGVEAGEVRVAGVGRAATRSSRWNVPPPAACARSAVIADTMLPAAPVTTNVVSGVSARAGSARARLLDQGRSSSAGRRRGRSRRAPGSRSVSSTSDARRGSAVLRDGAKSTALISASGRSRAQRLREAGDGAAHHGRRARRRRSRGGRRGACRRQEACRSRAASRISDGEAA